MPGNLKKYYVVGPVLRHHETSFHLDPIEKEEIAEEHDFTVLNQEDIRKWFQHQETHQLFTAFNEGPTMLRPRSNGLFHDPVDSYPVIFEVFIANDRDSPLAGQSYSSSDLIISQVYHGEQKEFYPKSYHSILSHPDNTSSAEPVLNGIKTLFYNYEHPTFLSMHWRYQKQIAKKIENYLPDSLEEARTFLVEERAELSKQKGFNPNGELARRLDFSISAVSNEIMYRNFPDLKAKEVAAIKAAHAESKENKSVFEQIKDFLHLSRRRPEEDHDETKKHGL